MPERHDIEEQAPPPAAPDSAAPHAAPEAEPQAAPDAPPAPADPLAEMAAKADTYLGLAQRTQADFENYRKRMTREVGAAEARGAGRLAKELLPALDNLERALAAVEAHESDEHHLTKGIRLVQAELSNALARAGIESFDPHGAVFDPSEHEAVAQQPAEGSEPGTIIAVVQTGYRMNGAMLRPARVVVAGA